MVPNFDPDDPGKIFRNFLESALKIWKTRFVAVQEIRVSRVYRLLILSSMELS